MTGRTLLISEVFPPQVGGSGRYLWEIYRRLPGAEVVIAAGVHPRQEAFDAAHGLDVVRLPLALAEPGTFSPRGLAGYARAVGALRRLAIDRGVGQVHCARCVVEGWMGWLLQRWCGVPYLCFAHGEEVKLASAGDGGYGVMSSRQLRWMTHRVLRGAERIVCNSRNTARILAEEWGLPASRLALLHPGVDIHRFVPAPRDPRTRARLGWGDRPVLLTVARLQERKGHDRMIRALHRVRREAPDVLYAIVGDGPERAALERLVAREGLGAHVRFLGEVDDEALVPCYQQCDLFVHPNRQVGRDIEGFGMVLLEAQACGKPVVAGDSGGTAETMSIPETGRVVPCDDPRPLGDLVAGLLADGDSLARMGEAARLWVVDRFDWDVLARRAGRIFAGEALEAAGHARPAQLAPTSRGRGGLRMSAPLSEQAQRRGTRIRRRRWIFPVLALGLGVLLAEFVVSLACLASPRLNYYLSPSWNRITLADPVLQHRLSPYTPGHDRRGYRNEGVPERCEVLAVGDSMTYGYAAEPAESWPRQLERLSGKTVYNGGVGKYGPCEYEFVLDELLDLQPRTVVVGIYLGNDAIGGYVGVYHDRRFPRYRSRDEAVLKEVGEIEKRSPWGPWAARLNAMPGAAPAEGPGAVRRWISSHSSLYAIARSLRGIGGRESIPRGPWADPFEVAARRPLRVPYTPADPRLRTVFLPPDIDAQAIDLDDPRIREGLRITENVLRSIKSKLAAKGIRLIVLLMPNKPVVYAHIAERDKLPESFSRYIAMEEEITRRMEEFLTREGIEFVDTTPALQACLERGERPYPEADDVHFNGTGYRAIAAAALPLVQSPGPPESRPDCP